MIAICHKERMEEDIQMSNPSSTSTNEDKIAIGIDIGIAHSRVTLFKDNKFQHIPNQAGHLETPSYVAFTDNGILIGEEARN